LQHGRNEGAILKQAYIAKQAIPAFIRDAPELLPGLQFFYDAFKALTTCRGSAYSSEGPIPWTAMRDYCVEYDVDLDDREYLYAIISHMDDAYLNFKAEKMKSK
jgi:hypothetical protein